ncbi:GerAB/ArcD/ProY family transporter [Clostridium peptidivorans]|uniref:GerAB/ArcD/ProY family transporter n=1 Tax=Clostridium peptidivorans TaxID=100174 RepID=UPI000BE3BA99|nr:GerAB/ArcD/ProY family transporter [Clostridium peptidivorans]
MKTIIEDKYIIFLLFSGVVGLFTNIPKEYATYVGTGGWVIIIIDLLLILPPSFAIIWLNKQYEGKIIPEYLVEILGKYIAFPINIIYFIRFFIIVPLMTRALLVMVKSTTLETTPIWPLALVFISCACYAATQGIKSLAYICQFFVLIALAVSSILFFALLSKGGFINLRPFFVKEDIPLYFKESIRNLRIFFGAGVLFVMPFSKKDNKKANIYLLIGYIIITLFYLFVFWGTVAVAGINQTVLFDDIFFIAVRSVEIQNLEILKRLDGLAITAFIFTSLMTVAIDIYGAAVILKYYLEKTKIPKKTTFSFSCIATSIAGFVFCIIIPNTFALKQYLSIAFKMAWLTAFIIPMILFVIVKIKNRISKETSQ